MIIVTVAPQVEVNPQESKNTEKYYIQDGPIRLIIEDGMYVGWYFYE